MKVIVAHPVQQHSYRLAIALKRVHMLEKYATTVYYRKNSFTYFAAWILKGKFKQKAKNRRCEELNDIEVIQFCEWGGLLKLLALNTPLLKNHYNDIKYKTADRFAKKAAAYAITHKADAVVTYDNTSPILFEILKREAPEIVRILDVSAANPAYMKKIYEDDFLLAPEFEERLRRERQLVWNPAVEERTKKELELSQKFLVPSSFVENSLKFSGIKKEQMFRCPYGVDIREFHQKTYQENYKARPLEFIYVGGVKELKGIYYLLEAFRQIPKEKAYLTIVGKADLDSKDMEPYLSCADFTGMVLHSDIPGLLRHADVFLFPSLGEGLSLSALEAAACGLPLIVSENSGINDGMTDGVEGFVISIQSIEAIREKVFWFTEHPEEIKKMGDAARKLALSYTWEEYYRNIGDIFKSMSDTGGNI